MRRKQDWHRDNATPIVVRLHLPRMAAHGAPSPIFNRAPTISTSFQRVPGVPSAATFFVWMEHRVLRKCRLIISGV